jgi:serine protease Do
MARELGYSRGQRGVVVTDIDPSGLAARAGIRPGDMVVSIGGQVIESIADFRQAVAKLEPEGGIRLQIERDGVRRFVFIRR